MIHVNVTYLSRLVGYLICLSMAGCCGMCKKGYPTCIYSNPLPLTISRTNKTPITDTINIYTRNIIDGSVTLTKLTLPFRIDPDAPYLGLSLGTLTPNFAYERAESFLALKNYEFDLYVNQQPILKIDSIKTKLVLEHDDECYRLECPKILSFRENGTNRQNNGAILIRY